MTDLARMRILIVTQNENVYLPASLASVCRAFGNEVSCIVAAPAMSTHGGPVKGLIRHLRLFGVGGTFALALRVLRAHVSAVLHSRPTTRGPFYSIRGVARGFKIPYYHVVSLRSETFDELLERYCPDLLISISCPQIIGRRIRDRFARGCINVHGAPLPKYRGLMPAFWALRNGETHTAVTVHELGDKLDNGAILLQREVAISPEDTWESLVIRSKAAAAEALVEAVGQIRTDRVQRRPNRDDEATYFSFPDTSDRRTFRAAGRRFF